MRKYSSMCKSTQAQDLVGGGAGREDVEEAPVSGVASEKPVLNPKRDREGRETWACVRAVSLTYDLGIGHVPFSMPQFLSCKMRRILQGHCAWHIIRYLTLFSVTIEWRMGEWIHVCLIQWGHMCKVWAMWVNTQQMVVFSLTLMSCSAAGVPGEWI